MGLAVGVLKPALFLPPLQNLRGHLLGLLLHLLGPGLELAKDFLGELDDLVDDEVDRLVDRLGDGLDHLLDLLGDAAEAHHRSEQRDQHRHRPGGTRARENRRRGRAAPTRVFVKLVVQSRQ